ncbi:uncharacterized protein LOC143021418 [Oratosquilla oratoria]|uniref:uncharacterized protein LOC143021418 n=1 Tax=Oratosquilla oratoria TaxID=337810 RepID=UPI003F76C9E0
MYWMQVTVLLTFGCHLALSLPTKLAPGAGANEDPAVGAVVNQDQVMFILTNRKERSPYSYQVFEFETPSGTAMNYGSSVSSGGSSRYISSNGYGGSIGHVTSGGSGGYENPVRYGSSSVSTSFGSSTDSGFGTLGSRLTSLPGTPSRAGATEAEIPVNALQVFTAPDPPTQELRRQMYQGEGLPHDNPRISFIVMEMPFFDTLDHGSIVLRYEAKRNREALPRHILKSIRPFFPFYVQD